MLFQTISNVEKKRDILNNVHTALFHAMYVNADQAQKSTIKHDNCQYYIPSQLNLHALCVIIL